MKALQLGQRRPLLGVPTRLLLFDDRVEEVRAIGFELEITRLFFDELRCATVTPRRHWLEPLALIGVAFLGVAGGTALARAGDVSISPVAGLTLVFFSLLLLAVGGWLLATPAPVLTLYAADHKLDATLPRRAGARRRRLTRLVEAVEAARLRARS